jgi:hypothetical protein
MVSKSSEHFCEPPVVFTKAAARQGLPATHKPAGDRRRLGDPVDSLGRYDSGWYLDRNSAFTTG